MADFETSGTIICASEGLTVEFTDKSTFQPTSYEWDVDGDNIVDYTTKDVSHTYSTGGSYTITLTVTNAFGTDSKTKRIFVGAQTSSLPCSPIVVNEGFFQAGIKNFKFGTIDFTSTVNDNGNDEFLDLICSQNTFVEAGETYIMNLNLESETNQNVNVWIDWNGDGQFNQTNELVFENPSVGNTFAPSITIPSDAVLGKILRVRVFTDFFTEVTDPCNDTEYGEVNDYGILIECLGAPTPDITNLTEATGDCSVDLTAPTATDLCDGSTITGTTEDPTSYSDQGTYNVTWIYTGTNGETSSQTQSVVVDDQTAPVADVTNLSDIEGQCEVTSLVTPTATDECDGPISGTHDATLPITTNTTIIQSILIPEGNESTQTQEVIINDTESPVADVATLNDITAECEVTSLTAPTATDNCDGELTGTHNVTLPISQQGTTVVSWTYTDANGNTTTQTQDVVIEDVTNPAPDQANLAEINEECEVTSLTAPTATDNCSGEIIGTHDATLPITQAGTTTLTWTYIDDAGNETTQTQDVIINDNTAPIADSPTLAAVNEECEVTELPQATATDNCAEEINGVHDATLPITQAGTTTVTWTYTDAAGNETTQTQEVTIADQSAPTPNNATLQDINSECEVTSGRPFRFRQL